MHFIIISLMIEFKLKKYYQNFCTGVSRYTEIAELIGTIFMIKISTL